VSDFNGNYYKTHKYSIIIKP